MLEYSYDKSQDIIYIEGVPYSGELFRTMGKIGFEPQGLFLMQNENGALTITSMQSDCCEHYFAPAEYIERCIFCDRVKEIVT